MGTRGNNYKLAQCAKNFKSFHVTGTSAMYVNNPLDSENIVVGAWVHLDSDELGNDHDMRTVFTNKAAGCENNAKQFGLSLYINAWQQHDHRVYAEYGSKSSGCHKVSSTQTVSVNKWFHIAVAMHTDPSNTDRGITQIYVDGSLVATSTEDAPPHSLQRNNKFFRGAIRRWKLPFRRKHQPLGRGAPCRSHEQVDIGQLSQNYGCRSHQRRSEFGSARFGLWTTLSRARPGKPYQVWVPKTCKVPM